MIFSFFLFTCYDANESSIYFDNMLVIKQQIDNSDKLCTV